jgi:hypothetical protein
MSPRWNWDSPTPLAASECALPPVPKGGGAHSPAAKGVGESQFQRLEKRLALCPLCGSHPYLSLRQAVAGLSSIKIKFLTHFYNIAIKQSVIMLDSGLFVICELSLWKNHMCILVGFGLACAPVRCAHSSFWTHCHGKRGAARPPPIAASLLLIRSPKID